VSHSGRLRRDPVWFSWNGESGKLWGIKTRKSGLRQQELLRTGHARMTLDRA
jgi:hypothetical protein